MRKDAPQALQERYMGTVEMWRETARRKQGGDSSGGYSEFERVHGENLAYEDRFNAELWEDFEERMRDEM